MPRLRGFTLVELLVTISILAILMTIALISFGNIQRGARDGRRKSDISNIQSALEQYHADQGAYPSTITFDSPLTNQDGIIYPTPPPNPPPVKTYLPKIPKEANSSPYPAYSYAQSPSDCNNDLTNLATVKYCTNYCLYATVENSSSVSLACGSGQIYAVTAP